jgi:hypothetical protein
VDAVVAELEGLSVGSPVPEQGENLETRRRGGPVLESGSGWRETWAIA